MLHMAARRLSFLFDSVQLTVDSYKILRSLLGVFYFSDIFPLTANNTHMKNFIEKHKKLYFYILGTVTGLCNGLFGSGGGIAAVPMLQKGGVDVKKSHATSLALTLPLSVVSAFF